MRPFKHFDAATTEEAAALLSKYKGKARLIAGGTDILGVLTDDILPVYPQALVNLKTIPGLSSIREDNSGLRIGALAKLSEIASHPVILERYAIVAAAARSVAMPQVRNMGTIGGNLCQENRCWYYRYPNHLGGRLVCLRKGGSTCYTLTRDNRLDSIYGGPDGCFAVCPSDMATALAALDASVTTTRKTIPMEQFFTARPGVALELGEIVTEISLPRRTGDIKSAYMKFRLRKSIDFAMVSVACVLSVANGKCQDARIVLGAVAPTPWRATAAEDALKGRAMDGTVAEEAGQRAVSNATPLSMNGYKVTLAQSLVKRAILSAA